MLKRDIKSILEDKITVGRVRDDVRNRLRNILGLRVMVDFGVEQGLSVQTSLAGTGVPEGSLSDLMARVTVEQEMQVIRNLLVHLSSIPALGAQVGTRYHATAFGPLGVAITSSPTARTALAVALRFFNLTFALTRFDTAEVGGQTIVTIEDSFLPKDLRKFAVERDAATLVTVQRDLLAAHSALTSISFKFSAPESVESHKAIFGVRPTFAAKSNIARLDRDVLMLPLPQSNELAFRSAVNQCEMMLERQQAQVSLSDQIRELLTQDMTAWSDMMAASRYFCMTSRTLRRRLLDEGTTFAELCDDVRAKMAEELLRGSKLKINEVSALLGYATATTFISAFKRWKGVTPLAFRGKVKAEFG
jgi:AraC-like DNA-binding protein